MLDKTDDIAVATDNWLASSRKRWRNLMTAR